MDINPNLSLLMEKLFDNEGVVDRIMQTDDINELYILCQQVQDGYSFDEFVDFFESLVCICIDEAKDLKDFMENNADKIGQLSEKDLKNISGGISKADRFTASILASMIFLINGNVQQAHGISGADNTAEDILLRDAKPGEENKDWESVLLDASREKPTLEPSAGEKIKNWFNKAADYVWENKGAFIGGGLALAAAGAFLAYNNTTIGENVKKLVERHNDIERYKKQLDFWDHMPAQRPEVSFVDENHRLNYDIMDPNAMAELKWKQELYDEWHENNDRKHHDRTKNSLKAQLADAEGQGIIKTLTNNLSVIGGVSAILGGTATAISGLTGFVNKVAQTFTDVETVKYYYEKAGREVANMKSDYELALQIQDAKNYNADRAEKDLRYMFKNYIHGQEIAKGQVMSFFMQLSEERKAAAMGAASSELPGPQVLVFNGPSGTGKTFMAQLLSKSITGISPFFISAEDVLKTSKRDPASMSYGFFYGNTQKGGNSKEDMSTKNNNLMSFLKSTEGTIRVVIFDEWDKIYQKDSSGNYPYISPMDEMWRSILDNQYTDYSGKRIDLSGTVFIITTNETIASLQGRIEVDSEGKSLVEALVDENNNPVLDENGKQIYVNPKKDASRTQTVVPHDGSVMARLAGSICYFDRLLPNDYETIARDALGDDRTIKNVEDYGKAGRPDRVSLIRRLSSGIGGIVISDRGYRLIAEYASKMTNGARAIVGAGGSKTGSVAGNLDAALIKYIGELKKASKSCKDLVLYAEPSITKDSTKREAITFDIKPLGYLNEERTYEQYLEQYKDK